MLLLLLALCNSILSLWPATQWLVGRGDNSKCRQNHRLVLPTLAYIVFARFHLFLLTAYTRRGIACCFATMYTLMYFGLACANISFRFGVLILDFVFLSNTFVVTVVKVWWWLYIWTNRMWLYSSWNNFMTVGLSIHKHPGLLTATVYQHVF